MYKRQQQGQLNLDDSAIVIKDSHGRIHVHNEIDRGIKVGALGGGMLGPVSYTHLDVYKRQG